MNPWRFSLTSGITTGNEIMCDVPDEIRRFTDVYCRHTRKGSCPKIPCKSIYTTSNTSTHITCEGNSRIGSSATDEKIHCIKSPTLDLFTHGPPYPSIVYWGGTSLTSEFFANVLSRHYRSRNSIWALLLNGESIGHFPLAGDKRFLPLFDLTVGYDRQRYDVITPCHMSAYQHLLTNARVSFESVLLDKTSVPSYVTSPVLWMNSNCHSPFNRTGYMMELMLHIQVDAWGKCGNNKGDVLPPSIALIHGTNSTKSHYDGKWTSSKMAMAKNYLFTVAIENSLEYDYITEKLWQPLASGSVPIYLGAPNIDDWLPCENCIIDLRKFESPAAAAKFILAVANNKTHYAEYHQWRKQPLPLKFQQLLDYFKRANAYSIDCMVCHMAHSDDPKLKLHQLLNDIGPIFGSSKKN